MATVIDELVVELGLDPTKLKQGGKEGVADLKKTEAEATRTAKSMESRGNQAGQFFTKVRNQALALFTVFTAGEGIKNFVLDTIKSDAAIGRMAKTLGVATEELSAWQGVASRNGGTPEGITATLQMLTNAKAEFDLTGNTSNSPFLSALGLKPEDLNTATGALLKMADARNRFSSNQKFAFALRGAGIDEDTIRLLQQGRGAIEAQLVEQQRLGGATAESAAKAAILDAKLNDLSRTSKSFGRTLLGELAPAMETVLTDLIAFSEEVKNSDWTRYEKETKSLVTSLTHLGDTFTDMMRVMASSADTDGKKASDLLENFKNLADGLAHTFTAIKLLAKGDLMGAATEMQAAMTSNMKALSPYSDNPAANAPGAASSGAGRPAGWTAPHVGYDQDLAIRTLMGEARPGQGQVDVAHTILNRQRGLGQTAGQVVQARKQFSVWNTAEGRAKLMAYDPHSQAYQDAAWAWQQAANEDKQGIDPTGGSDHYYAPSGMPGGVAPDWVRKVGADPTLQREGHRFYKLGMGGIRAGAGASQDASGGSDGTSATPGPTTVTIAKIDVLTQATDAKGIARDLGGALRSNLAAQANSGLR